MVPWPKLAAIGYRRRMTPPVDPMTNFFLAAIRQAALVEFIKLSGLHSDILAACLDRAAEAAATSADPQKQHAESLRRAVALAEEEAKQVRRARAKG